MSRTNDRRNEATSELRRTAMKQMPAADRGKPLTWSASNVQERLSLCELASKSRISYLVTSRGNANTFEIELSNVQALGTSLIWTLDSVHHTTRLQHVASESILSCAQASLAQLIAAANLPTRSLRYACMQLHAPGRIVITKDAHADTHMSGRLNMWCIF
jgi:hypothetical protein